MTAAMITATPAVQVSGTFMSKFERSRKDKRTVSEAIEADEDLTRLRKR